MTSRIGRVERVSEEAAGGLVIGSLYCADRPTGS
jgi:hypothetical protein